MSKLLAEMKAHLTTLTSARAALETAINAYIDELEAEVDEEAEEQDESLASKIDDARNAGDSCDTIDSELDDLYSFLGISPDGD